MNKKPSAKDRFIQLGERADSAAWFDEYHLETVLRLPFLSKVKTSYGQRWVLKYSQQSRSADSGVRRVSILLARAKNVREALAESAAFLKCKTAKFESGSRTRGYIFSE